ncbi:electron transport complex subunit RsxC [Pseudidiomarina aestuarii]|uniref:Ion-translocating oxidoreductase complex subunit C n=1 Tax=Pseudidiomarina aestuarii TaxID=624146 RepID=A0A7Z7ETR5_9GAMM|nr:electron transport complex subunit RsxC [Pseudidiomarina aestuarii]RUO41290.1 electron transport complex subunit RsxC [Pseudidiomarina aestuarii]
MTADPKTIAAGHIWTFPGGIHPPERKELSNTYPLRELPLATHYSVPIKQHSGEPGDIIVRVGQTVLAGQPLTQVGVGFGLPVHAPTSGTVTAIGPGRIAHPSGLPDIVITITADGKDTFAPPLPIQDVATASRADLLEQLRQAGIAGLGGAGFPTAQKLALQRPLDYLIINGVECEPYISADDRLMREQASTILRGADLLLDITQCPQALIAIEDNKPEAIAAMQAALTDYPRMQLRVVPTKYPSGGEKQLIQLLTGRQVPSRGLPIDIGLVMHNVGTAYAVARAIDHGEPLLQRVVTVTGEHVAKPGNYWVRLGTPVEHVLQVTRYTAETNQRVIMGGPMMGFTLPDLTVPVVKITNCILVPSTAELAPPQQEMPCIRCGACADVCPAQLLPQQLQWLAKAKDYDGLNQQNLFDCIECGACAYVCPSEIPLVHYYRKAKAEVRNIAREKAKAEVARKRFEARNERLEREKAERLERHRKAAEARKQAQAEAVKAGADNPQDAVQAAIARAKARKAAQLKEQQANSEPDGEST